MTTHDNRLGPGTLTVGGTDFGGQVSNVGLIPTKTSTDGTPTLGTPEPAPDESTTWALKGNAVQDWAVTGGFAEYCRLNDGDEVAFSWVPNTDLEITYSGTCKVHAIDIGGDVAKQNTSSFEFAVVGAITRVAA